MHNLTNWLVQSLKHDSSYQVDRHIAPADLLSILTHRGAMYLRGRWYRLWLKRCGGSLFVGKQVTLRHRQMISVGRSVILEDYVTMDALSTGGITLGDCVTIARGVTIKCTGVVRNLGVGLTVGENSAIGAFSFVGAQGGVTIGNNVIIGPHVNFHAENHRFDSLDRPIRLQGESRQGIVIADDCWIGAGAIVTDGVQIGSGSVVGAGSVVTKSIPPFSVAAGVPARVLKNRQAGKAQE